MRRFFAIQGALLAVTLLLCLHARGLSRDMGITGMDTIGEIHQCGCSVSVIHDSEELADRFSQFDKENADPGAGLYGTAIFTGTPRDSFAFSKGSTFCTIEVERVIKGELEPGSIDAEIKGGLHYETEAEQRERLTGARDMGIETPAERLFTLDLGGMDLMVPGKRYLIIAQTLDIGGEVFYRINGYQVSWLCLEGTESVPVSDSAVYRECWGSEVFSYDREVIEEFYRRKGEVLGRYGLRV